MMAGQVVGERVFFFGVDSLRDVEGDGTLAKVVERTGAEVGTAEVEATERERKSSEAEGK
jgi:hypothetical protein